MTSDKFSTAPFSRTLRFVGAAAVAGLASASLLAISATPAHAATNEVTVTKVNGVVIVTTPNVPPIGPNQPASYVAIDDYGTTRMSQVVLRFRRVDGGAVVARSGCVQLSVSEAHCGTPSSVTKVVVQGSESVDWVHATGTTKDVDFFAQGGDDVMVGSRGSDMFDGGNGNDHFGNDSNKSKDLIKGGAGIDEASYASSPGPVIVALDDYHDDGQPGEADQVMSDVENLMGSKFGDILTGTSVYALKSTANWIRGGNGDDKISGLGGNDILAGDDDYGEIGDDELYGGDGDDVMDGGNGSDYILGQSGIDQADGGYIDGEPDLGSDICMAETEVNCES